MAVRVGIDVAAFTECQVLSPASWLDFSAHIRELLECGRRAAALQLWDSVCEIVHLGSPCSTSVLQVQGMPPLLQVPCCNENCRRCEEHRGGFQFPWLGTWSRRAVLVQSGTPLNEAWASYHLNEEKLDLLAIQFVASPMSREDILPDHVARMLQLLAAQPTGGYPLDAAWEAMRSWQLGHRRWREPWRVGRPMPGAPSLIMGGKIMWVLLGATESEMEFIPKPCPICCSPCFSHCLFCCHKICGECNFIRTFCPFCAGSGSD